MARHWERQNSAYMLLNRSMYKYRNMSLKVNENRYDHLSRLNIYVSMYVYMNAYMYTRV